MNAFQSILMQMFGRPRGVLGRLGGVIMAEQQFPEARKSQHSSGLPTCLFVNRHAKMGLS
jgi:hypothetical protein